MCHRQREPTEFIVSPGPPCGQFAAFYSRNKFILWYKHEFTLYFPQTPLILPSGPDAGEMRTGHPGLCVVQHPTVDVSKWHTDGWLRNGQLFAGRPSLCAATREGEATIVDQQYGTRWFGKCVVLISSLKHTWFGFFTTASWSMSRVNIMRLDTIIAGRWRMLADHYHTNGDRFTSFRVVAQWPFPIHTNTPITQNNPRSQLVYKKTHHICLLCANMDATHELPLFAFLRAKVYAHVTLARMPYGIKVVCAFIFKCAATLLIYAQSIIFRGIETH